MLASGNTGPAWLLPASQRLPRPWVQGQAQIQCDRAPGRAGGFECKAKPRGPFRFSKQSKWWQTILKSRARRHVRDPKISRDFKIVCQRSLCSLNLNAAQLRCLRHHSPPWAVQRTGVLKGQFSPNQCLSLLIRYPKWLNFIPLLCITKALLILY